MIKFGLFSLFSFGPLLVNAGLSHVDEDKSPCLAYSFSSGHQWHSLCRSQHIANRGLCVLYMYPQFILLSLSHKVGSC
jgi:hypothetical protein